MESATVELPKTRRIPVWLAILLILACAGGGGYLAYKFLLGGSNEKIVLLEHSPNQRIQQARWPRDSWIVPGSMAQLLIDMSNPAKPHINYLIFRHDMTHEQNVLLSASQRDVSNELDLSNDQLRRIRALGNAGHVEPPRPVVDAMEAQFVQWQKTPPGQAKDQMENKLISMLDDATVAINDKSKAAQTSQADKIKALLTPQQQQKVLTIHLRWER